MKPSAFTAGQYFKAGGVEFRVSGGRKGNGDLRLDWRIDGYWKPVVLDAVFAVMEFVTENEDRLYPYPARGGEEVLRYMRIARVQGWREASRLLHLARVRKVERDEAHLYRSEP